MASKDEINTFSRRGDVGDEVPNYTDIPHGTIRHYSPNSASADPYTLEIEAIQRDPNDPDSYFGKYVNISGGWTPDAVQFLEGMELDYNRTMDFLYASTIPEVFGSDWRVTAFKLAKLSTGQLAAFLKWENPTTGEEYKTAYDWPPCEC